MYSYSCLSGYTLDGPDTRTCNTVDGTWTPENEPTCKGMYWDAHDILNWNYAK